MESNLSGATGQTGSGGQVTEQARQQGQQLAQQARQQASNLANRGGEQVKSQLAYQKHDASQRMVPIQSALRETAQQLRRQGQGPVADYTDQAAEQIERFSGYLRDTDVEEIVDEARGFARRRPALFLGGALALGFLGTRFLKSSSQEASYAGDGEPVAALPPASAGGEPLATGRTPTTTTTTRTVERTPMREADRLAPPGDL